MAKAKDDLDKIGNFFATLFGGGEEESKPAPAKASPGGSSAKPASNSRLGRAQQGSGQDEKGEINVRSGLDRMGNVTPGSTTGTIGGQPVGPGAMGAAVDPIDAALKAMIQRLQSLDPNDPQVQQVTSMAADAAMRRNQAAGVQGGLAGTNVAQGSANALTALQSQRDAQIAQLLGLQSNRQLTMNDLRERQRQFDTGMNEQRLAQQYAAQQQQQGLLPSLLGGGLGALAGGLLGSFAGPGGALTGAGLGLNFGSQAGAGLGMANAPNPYLQPSPYTPAGGRGGLSGRGY